MVENFILRLETKVVIMFKACFEKSKHYSSFQRSAGIRDLHFKTWRISYSPTDLPDKGFVYSTVCNQQLSLSKISMLCIFNIFCHWRKHQIASLLTSGGNCRGMKNFRSGQPMDSVKSTTLNCISRSKELKTFLLPIFNCGFFCQFLRLTG